MTRSLLSLFSGCGGLDYGLEAAGFEPKLCVEIDEDCRRSLTLSRPHWALCDPGDVTKLSPKMVLEQCGVKRRELDLLAGGPPCQPFSKAAFWHQGAVSRMEDPRAVTLVSSFNVIEATLPRVVLLENVAGLAYRGMDEGWKYCTATFGVINRRNRTNYRPTLLQINAADYGVPQIRHRVFVVAEREGREFRLPAPTHDPCGETVANYRTAWDAIGDEDLNDEDLCLTGKWAELIPTIPEGQNYLWHTRKGGGLSIFGWRTRYWSFLLKLAKSLPAWTIQANPGPATGPFHWRNRLLSTFELQRLQTFPDDITIAGDARSVRRQVGNAVPSALGELLGLEIRRQFFGAKVRRKLTLIPNVREGRPSPHAIAPVPAKYVKLVDAHPDHPGPGLGPGRALQPLLPTALIGET